MLYVITYNGKPFELPPEGDVSYHLDGHGQYALASTDRNAVERLRLVLPDLLDMDGDSSQFEIKEYS